VEAFPQESSQEDASLGLLGASAGPVERLPLAWVHTPGFPENGQSGPQRGPSGKLGGLAQERSRDVRKALWPSWSIRTKMGPKPRRGASQKAPPPMQPRDAVSRTWRSDGQPSKKKVLNDPAPSESAFWRAEGVLSPLAPIPVRLLQKGRVGYCGNRMETVADLIGHL